MCQIAKCDRLAHARHRCTMHYKRWLRKRDGSWPSRKERFWKKVKITPWCWVWMGAKASGYGRFRFRGKIAGAHRIAYEWIRGPIPPGLGLDHLCRNSACVNPHHLEVVPQSVNILRGFSPPAINARKTKCIRGHSLAYCRIRPNGERQCRICDAMRQRIAYASSN